MTTLHLNRFCEGPMGTFGRLTGTNGFACYTVERPWMDNAKFVSCIPPGVYQVQKRWYAGGGYDALEVLDVPGRADILIHVGNTMDDVQGCIAVGRALGYTKTRRMHEAKWSVVGSKPVLVELLESLDLLSGVELRVAWTIPRVFVDPKLVA